MLNLPQLFFYCSVPTVFETRYDVIITLGVIQVTWADPYDIVWIQILTDQITVRHCGLCSRPRSLRFGRDMDLNGSSKPGGA